MKFLSKVRFKVPDKHTLVHKGEHFFHGTYTGYETFFGHDVLHHIATGAFVCIVLDLVLHWVDR